MINKLNNLLDVSNTVILHASTIPYSQTLKRVSQTAKKHLIVYKYTDLNLNDNEFPVQYSITFTDEGNYSISNLSFKVELYDVAKRNELIVHI